MKRRKFLKSVAHAGAAGLILPQIMPFEIITPGSGFCGSTIGSDKSGLALNSFGSEQYPRPGLKKNSLVGVQRQNIKITDVKVRLFSVPIPPEKWWYGCGVEVLTEIYTDQGIIGIGGPSNYGDVENIKKYTEQTIKPLILGLNPFDLDLINDGDPKLKIPVITSRNFTETCAWGGVNNACWDIVGKAVKQPVWKLLAAGKKAEPHIEHYASAGTLYDWKKRPEDLYDEALQYKEQGIKSFKYRLGENFEQTTTLKQFITFIRKLRETVGPDFRLMQESNMRLTLDQCLELVPVLEELNYVWFEEPINRQGSTPELRRSSAGVQEAIEGHIKIRKATKKLLISGGETMRSREEFREWIERDAYDIVQPDCDTTGITEGWHIAGMAGMKNKPCIPHNWHGGLTWMANIQLVAAIPNRMVLESNRNFNPFREGLFTEPIVVKNSFADAPSKPGLGVEIIPDADKKFPYDPKNDWRNMKRS